MWGLFQLTFELGSIPMDYIDAAFIWLGEQTKTIVGDGALGSLIADGMISGVGAVVMFLPNIVILFIGIALLETTGYMSRVAFLLDGFFHKFGLHGKSFIPLVTGFGCSVPAYMAARTLKNEKDRLITLFIIGFMSCGARLPIYVLFAGAFFAEQEAGSILFIIYISGAILGLFAAKALKLFVFKGEDEPFVMEMPKYRLPSLKLIWHTVYGQAKSYLKKAGTFILAASMLIWFASNYPKNEALEEAYAAKIELAANEAAKTQLSNELTSKLLEESYLGQIGHATAPFFAPLGFDWRMSVALEAGLAAKEVVVSTLGVLYALGSDTDEENEGLVAQIRANIPFCFRHCIYRVCNDLSAVSGCVYGFCKRSRRMEIFGLSVCDDHFNGVDIELYCVSYRLINQLGEAMLLSQLHKGDQAQIVKINADKTLKDRFASFGIMPGEVLMVKAYTIAKQTMKIKINGTYVALRAEEANKIEVIKL